MRSIGRKSQAKVWNSWYDRPGCSRIKLRCAICEWPARLFWTANTSARALPNTPSLLTFCLMKPSCLYRRLIYIYIYIYIELVSLAPDQRRRIATHNIAPLFSKWLASKIWIWDASSTVGTALDAGPKQNAPRIQHKEVYATLHLQANLHMLDAHVNKYYI